MLLDLLVAQAQSQPSAVMPRAVSFFARTPNASAETWDIAPEDPAGVITGPPLVRQAAAREAPAPALADALAAPPLRVARAPERPAQAPLAPEIGPALVPAATPDRARAPRDTLEVDTPAREAERREPGPSITPKPPAVAERHERTTPSPRTPPEPWLEREPQASEETAARLSPRDSPSERPAVRAASRRSEARTSQLEPAGVPTPARAHARSTPAATHAAEADLPDAAYAVESTTTAPALARPRPTRASTGVDERAEPMADPSPARALATAASVLEETRADPPSSRALLQHIDPRALSSGSDVLADSARPGTTDPPLTEADRSTPTIAAQRSTSARLEAPTAHTTPATAREPEALRDAARETTTAPAAELSITPAPAARVVHVHVGRIIVRAPARDVAAREQPAKPAARMSLDDYLERRKGTAR